MPGQLTPGLGVGNNFPLMGQCVKWSDAVLECQIVKEGSAIHPQSKMKPFRNQEREVLSVNIAALCKTHFLKSKGNDWFNREPKHRLIILFDRKPYSN